MQSKLSRICDGIIEAGWLAALVATPLFFDTLSNRVFEPDKIHLLRSIALVMVVAWIVQLLDGGWRSEERAWPGLAKGIRPLPAVEGLRTPLALPTLILAAVYLISTATSVVPRISLLGSYVRLQGTYTFFSYVAIFALVITHVRTRAQLNRLSHAVILASLPISIYGIIQHYGIDPLPWGGNVTERVAANMGNAIFVGAYLILAVFITLERLVDSAGTLLDTEKGDTASALRAGAYLFVLAVQLITIVFTQSRGPWLGLAAGSYVFVMVGMLLAGRWAADRPRAPGWLRGALRPVWLGFIGLTAGILIFMVVLNLPRGPLAALRDKPYIGRMATIMNTKEGTNAVRVLIWEGVVDMMLKPHPPIQAAGSAPDRLNAIRPLIGYGPESMWVAYNRFYPPDLAHYEARNASPDRSHNEAFDALVRTGLLGFAAQIYLFGSVFYWSLRWLGLMRGKRRHTLFLGMLAIGAALGVLIPLLVDGSLRLAGIGLPAGLIAGMIVYLTVDLLVGSPGPQQVSDSGHPDEAREPGAPAIPGPASAVGVSEVAHGQTGVPLGGAKRQLLILAAFAAMTAFFVEVHFGIAIVSTLTLFWTLAALLVVVGMGWVQESTQPSPIVAAAAPAANLPQAAGNAKARRRETRADRSGPSTRAGTAQVVKAPQAAKPNAPSTIRAFLPFAAIAAVVTLVLTWNFLLNQSGAEGAFAILWSAFTTRPDKPTSSFVTSPGLLIMMVFTWLVGGIVALTERAQPFRGLSVASRWGARLAIYLGATVGVFLGYGLFQARRLEGVGLTGMAILRRVVSHIAVFDFCLLLALLGLAAAIVMADLRPRPARLFGAHPALTIAVGTVAAVVALLIIAQVNIRTIQADTYYKQGLAYEDAGAWEGAVLLYREATRLEPQEDFYYLFLGRALLQLVTLAQQSGSAAPPQDLTGLKIRELQSIVDAGIENPTRDNLLRATQAALVAARSLNPLNTDHSANLARLYRTWAFAKALGSDQMPDNETLRQMVQTTPGEVDLPKLAQARQYYEEAVSLSPQNAQLWNELATVQFIQGDLESAMQTLDRALTLDPEYSPTYQLRGDIFSAMDDKSSALKEYRQAAALSPADLTLQSAIGVLSAQLGDIEGALGAFGRISETETTALQAIQQQLAELDAEAKAAGGYAALSPAARDRQTALQSAISVHSSRLYGNYRNMALVLRDAGRVQEALETAQKALALASYEERPTIEALIADLKGKTGQ